MPDGRPTWNVLGERVVCLLTGAETAGAHSLFEITSPEGSGPPPHLHRREDEVFYVLEGEFEFWTPEGTRRLGPGEAIFAPRDRPHTYKSVGPGRSRMLMQASPAGMDRFFAEVDREIGPRPPEAPKLIAILDRWGIELAAPPG